MQLKLPQILSSKLLWWFIVFFVNILTVNSQILLNESFNSSSIPVGWSNSALQGTQAWTIRNAPVFSSSSSGFYVVFDDNALGSVVFPNEAKFTSPVLNCTGRLSIKLNYTTYWASVEGSHGFVEVSSNNGISWNIVKDYSSASAGTVLSPITESLDVSAFISNQFQIRFRYTDGSASGKYWYIDDIIIYTDPDVGITKLIAPQYLDCSAPTSYSNNELVTVRIFNYSINPVSNIPVNCNISGGITQTISGTYTGTISGGSFADYTLPTGINMSISSAYHLKAFSQLSADQFHFNDTLIDGRFQKVSAFPFFETFDGISNAGWQAGCSNATGADRWFEHAALPYLNGAEGNGKSWFVNTSATNSITDEIWIESPVFDFQNVTSPKLSFDIKYQLDNSDYVWVQYSTNGGVSWSTLGSNNDANWYNGVGAGNNYWLNNFANPINSWTNVTQRMCSLSGFPCVIFRIRMRPLLNAIGAYFFALDNFRISAGEADDVEPVALYAPQSGRCAPLFLSTELVRLIIKNNTCRPLTNIPVSITQSGAATSTLNEIIPGPVYENERYIYDFTGKLNLTNPGTHILTATTNLTTDSLSQNNTIVEKRYATKINSFPVLADFNFDNCGWVSGSNVLSSPNKRIFLCDTLPYLGGSNGNGKSWYVEVSAVNSVTSEIWAESPEYDLTNVSSGVFSMDIKYQLHNDDYVWVEYSTNGGATWTTLGTNNDQNWYNTTGTNNHYWRNNQNNPVASWAHVQHTLCNLANKPCVKFRIKAHPFQNTVDSTGGSYYFAFDNVRITELASDIGVLSYISPTDNGCLFGVNEQVRVSLFNFSCNTQTNIPIQCNISGSGSYILTDTIATDTIQPNSTLIYTFPSPLNLTATGTYNFTTFTSLVSDGNHANDTIRKNITVSQIKISSFPYLENFDTGNGYWITGSTDTTLNHRWFERANLPYLNGPELQGNSWFVNADAANAQTEEIWVESPVFDFTLVNEALLSMDIKYQLDNNNFAWVQYSTNGGVEWNTLGTNVDASWYNGIGSNNNWINNFSTPVTSWTTVQHFLCNLGGNPCVKFRVRARPFSNISGKYFFAFDNFKISLISSANADVGMNYIISPVLDGCLFSPPNKVVVVNVTNFGCSTASNIALICDITGPLNTTLTGTLYNSLTSNNSVNYTFPVSINMSDTGTYHFNAYTSYSGDIDHSNDSAYYSISVDQIKINTFPYMVDFNATNQYWKTGGNDSISNDRWFERGNLNYLNGSEGNGNSFFINTSSVNSITEEIWVESPVFDFTNCQNPALSMDIKYQLHNSDFVWMQYSTNGGLNWITLGSNADVNWYNASGAGNNYWRNNLTTPVNSWTNVMQSLCFLSGKNCVKFRISARPLYNAVDINGGYYYFAFDNFKIENTPGADDVMPVAFFQPIAGNCAPIFSSSENVAIIIQNNSCRSISGIPISILQTGAGIGAIYDTIPGPITGFSKYKFQFQETLDLSAAGTHILSATTNIANDVIPENNSYFETRLNNTISTFPYFENFNTSNGSWACNSTNFNNPNNRIFLHDTLPYLNGAEGNGQSWYIDVSSLNSVTSEIWVESPVFDFTSISGPKLMMDIKSQLHNSNFVWVEYTANGDSVWNTLGSNADPDWYNAVGLNNNYWRNNLTNPDSAWKTVQHSLCNLAGKACVKFRIKARPFYNTVITTPTNIGYYYFAFDNFRIIEGGDVGVVSYISPNNPECLFSVSEQVSVNLFNWGCTPAINTPITCHVSGALSTVLSGIVTDTIFPGTQTSFTFPQLIDMTQTGAYNIASYTQLAGDINHSNDTIQEHFLITQIKINTFPYLQDFNSGNAYWQTGSADTTINHRWFELGTVPYLNNSEGQGDSWFINADAVNNQTEEIWVESPLFDFSGIVNPTLSFDLKYQLHNFNYAWMQFSTDGGLSWTTLGNNTEQDWYNTTGANNNFWRNNSGTPINHWITLEHNLCELAGQSCVKFRFRSRSFYNTTGAYYFAFDNFHIYSHNLDVQTLDAAGCFGANSPVAVRIRNNSNMYSCGSGIALSSDIYNATNEARFAFDGNTTNSGWGNNGTLPTWLEYNFAGNPITLTKYKILCSSTQSGSWNSELYNPKTWKLQAFNGTAWITLDSISNGALQMDVLKEFLISNTVAYDRYRIYITAAEGGQRVHITELILLPMPSTIPAVNTITLNCNINGSIVSNVFSGLNLAPGSDTMLIMNGTFIPDAGSSVVIWSSLPNGQIDLRNYNDTIKPNIAAQWPNCNIHCINATELVNSVTITSSTYNLPDHPIYAGGSEDYSLNLCADPDTFTVDQSVWYYFNTNCNGGNVKVTFQSLNNGPLGIQVAILNIPNDTCACNPLYYNNVFCSVSDAALPTIIFSGTLPANSLYYIMVDPSGNTASDFKIVLEGSVDTLQSGLGSDTTICAARPFLLNSSEPGTFQWWIAGDTANIISTNQNFTVSPNIATTYFLEVTATSGCKITDSINIGVNPSYFATITPVAPLCNDYLPINLIAADTGGIWAGLGILNSMTGIFDPSVANAGTHQIIYSIPGTCGETDTTNITVIKRLYADITPIGPLCSDELPIALIAADSSGIWNGMGITDSILGIFNPAISGAGMHQIIYTISGQCGDADTTTITVNAVPNPTINLLGFICVHDSMITLAAADTGGIWSGAGITDSNAGLFSPSQAGSGTHQIKYTIAGLCAKSDSVMLTVHAPFNASISQAGPLCIAGNSVTLVAADTGGIWSGIGITDSLHGVFNPALAGIGAHQVVYSISGTCGNSDTSIISVVSLFNSNITASGLYCSNVQPVQLTAVDNGGIWIGSGITNAASGIFNPSVAGAGTHQIIYAFSGLCGTSDTTSITVIQSKNATITAPASICKNSSPITLTAANTGGIWIGSGITNNITGVFNPGFVSIGAHQIIYTISGTCGDADTVNITVNQIPVATVSNDTSICKGKSVTIKATGGTSYHWSNNATNAIITVTPVSSVWYFVTVSNSLCSVKDSVRITILNLPVVTISSNSPVCKGETIALTSGGGMQYSWSGPGGFASTDQNPSIQSALINDSGLYIVTVTGVNGCTNNASVNINVGDIYSIIENKQICFGSTYTLPGGNKVDVAGIYTDLLQTKLGCDSIVTTNLTVNPNPLVSISTIPDSLLLGQSINISASGAEQYHWSTGDITQSITNTPTAVGPVSICVTGYNSFNCDDKKCTDFFVYVIDCGDGQLFIPNAFSPNGDGSNDALCIYGKACIETLDFKIFDRLGEMVYESKNKSDCWNGLYKGKELNAAVFVFFLEAKLTDRNVVKLQGNISLMK